MGVAMKVFWEEAGGTLKSATAATGGEATFVKIKCNGKPFFCWPSVPPGTVIACDFTNAPIGTGDVAANAALIAAIQATPESVLTYDPPL